MSTVVVPSGDPVVVRQASSAVVVVERTRAVVVAPQAGRGSVVVSRGGTGRPGPPGQSGATYLTYVADGAIGGQRVVRATTAGKVGYVDPSDPAQAHAAIGLTMGAATDGASINVQFSGEMTEPSWAWAANQPIFAGANGVPTQTPPTTGFQAAIGVAISATSLVIQIKSPIVL